MKNGQPTAAIVVPVESSEEVTKASMELQKYIERCTGAELSVLSESRLESDEDLPGSLIYLGSCQETGKIIDQADIKPEELVILTDGPNLFITGKDGGTLYGAYQLLNKYLGVDWVMPGDIGDITPHSNKVILKEIDYRYQPPVLDRHIRNWSWRGAREEFLKNIGIENIEDTLAALREVAEKSPEDPFLKWGKGSRISLSFGHSYNDYWDKYGQEHPDFFALQANGSREQNPTRERLCVSNPDLWEFVAQRKIEEFRENPDRQMSSLCPNDGGGGNTFCMCERCQSWDPPDAPKINHGLIVNPETGERYEEYPSLSDRYFRFYNEVARLVAEVYPDKKLGVYAYSVYRTVPVTIDKLEPNLAVKVVSLDQDLIGEWSRLASEGQLYIRPNTFCTMGLSRNYARWIGEGVKFSVDHGAQGFDFDCGSWSWGTRALEYYVLMQTIWDPSIDVDRLIEKFYRNAYGKGAEDMKQFYMSLEELSTRIREEGIYRGRYRNPDVLPDYYTEEKIAELEDLLEKAKLSVGDEASKEYKRIRIVDDDLQYTKLAIRLLRIAKATGGTTDPAFKDAEMELNQFLRSHLRSWSTSYSGARRFLYRGINRVL